MLVPQALLALLCIALGLVPGTVLRILGTVMTMLPGLQPPAELARGGLAIASGLEAFDHLMPAAFALVLLGGLAVAWLLARRAAPARRVPVWGCGGELTARNEYTATAFSKPLMMIFRAIYRPTREVEALADVSPYFPREVRYRASIEPTFERHVYGPIARAVLRVADGLKVLQAGSLHAYLAYVIALVVALVVYVWWTG
jgi:hydrogenase-4 component B